MENLQFLLAQKQEIIDKHIYMTNSDLSGKITDISQAYLDFTGYKREDILGKNHKVFRNYDLDKNIIKQLWDTLLADRVWEGELKNNKASGEAFWAATIITPVYNKESIKTGYISILQDISDQKRLEALSLHDPLTLLYNRRYFNSYFRKELNRSLAKKEYFALILIGIDNYEYYKERYGDIIADRVVLQISQKLKKVLATTTYELFKVSESEFSIIIVHSEDSKINNLATKLHTCVETLSIETQEDESIDALTLSIGACNVNLSEYTLYCNDIYNITDSNLSKAKERGGNCTLLDIQAVAMHEIKNIDIITKLPNYVALTEDIDNLSENSMLILLHIQHLNRLKNLYGYTATLEIVHEKAQHLHTMIRDDDVSLYSYNLQEFAILVTNKKLFEKYLLLLEHSLLINNECYIPSHNKYVSANFTAGVAYGEKDILNHANLVLQEAIISKNSYMIYKKNQTAIQMQREDLKRLHIYKKALHEGNIIPYLQPIIDCNTAQVVKYEALARIQTEDDEIITPYYFLDAAKEDQSFEFFTRQMMQKVFNIYANNNICLSINISYENLTSQSMLFYIKNRLEKYGGEGITFEIVESEDIKDYHIVEEFITMIKGYGCKVSIDDFGSGYSNFSNLIQLDIDYIKFDGSLIQKLNKDSNIENMIQGLILYSKNANIKTIAEFVSSQELAQKVKELGIDYSQGYYFGEPRDPKEYGLK